MAAHDPTKFDCTNRRHARFLASGRSLSGRGAFFGLYALGAVLPAGKDQTLVDGVQRLVLCRRWRGAKIDPDSNN